MYDSWVYSGFNFALGLPIIFYGFMDRDIPADYALNNPKVLASLLRLIFNDDDHFTGFFIGVEQLFFEQVHSWLVGF
jgi:hypothetical protein